MAPRPRKPTSNADADGCLASVLAMMALPPMVLLDGWALSLMWGWFVVGPTGWAAIGVWEAAGLMAIKPIVSLRRSAADQKAEKDEGPTKSLFMSLFMSVFATLFSLGLGWVLHGLAT
jgi:hypothetical protein